MSATTVARARGRSEPRAASRERRAERLVLGLLGFVLVAVAWQLAASAGLIRKALFSSPWDIGARLVRDFMSGELVEHLAVSMAEFSLGLGLAILIGVPLGFLISMDPRVRAVVDPWLSALYATPTVALIPLIIVVMGIGMASKVLVVWLEAIVAIVVATAAGVGSCDHRHLDLATSFRAPRGLLMRSVVLPTALPHVITGVRIAVGRSLIGVIVAELLASNAGIGFFINRAGGTFDTNGVMAGIVILGVIGVTFGEILRRVERRFEKWRPEIS